MAEQTEKFDPKLAEGIAYFEQMLQVMPDDRTTLEFLCVAYEQLGDAVKQRTALVNLCRVLLKEKDLAAAEAIGERLSTYPDADARAMALRVKAALAPAPELVPEAPAVVSADGGLAGETAAAVDAERRLVDVFLAHGFISSERADALRAQLGACTSSTRPTLVSALAFLEKTDSVAADAAGAWLADTASAPPVPVEAFDAPAEARTLLPETFARVRGAVPFARLGDTWLVAAANPHDETFRHRVEEATKGACRFFLLDPHTSEEVLEHFYPVASAV